MVLPLVTFHPISQVVNAAVQSICPFAEENSPRRQATYLPGVRKGIADCVIKSPTRVDRGEQKSTASGTVSSFRSSTAAPQPMLRTFAKLRYQRMKDVAAPVQISWISISAPIRRSRGKAIMPLV